MVRLITVRTEERRLKDLAGYFRALDDRKRLAIIRYLANHDQITVTDLGRELRLSQPLISWHLRMLRRAGIVKTRRDGRQVLCSLNRRALVTYEQRVDRILGLKATAEEDGDLTGLPPEPMGPAISERRTESV